jgi:hypothetical protein
MPARNPRPSGQRAVEAARQRGGRLVTPRLDPVFVALNRDELPIRARSGGDLADRVRRAEDYAVLGARVVVELHTESQAARPSTRAWAITGRAQRAHRRHQDRGQRGERHQVGRVERTSRPQPGRELAADARRRHQPDELRRPGRRPDKPAGA